ncbi:PLP-dependent aminotransferase family protein [Paucibacter sp. APW11]|uniref:PLP-dependent aminotransferase family protein n=1 Tax=Roseateles aquae TaxID=3077235 RepID=A0ABU3PFE5_9BURK|nr:PLP-dependent aminotransferase family protein [Paucibacter sp. APW11]MDT9000646.1 PLP-dependent aminotransferase family protein [Paucibacter sp. APW11]
MSLPRYQELAQTLSQRIQAGEWAPGERLPSLRELCTAERLSMATAKRALELLQDQGLVQVRPQSGIFVAEPARAAASGRAAESAVLPEVNELRHLRERMLGLMQLAEQPLPVALQMAGPSAALLPAEAMARSIARLLRREPALLAEGAPLAGLPVLREALAERLRQQDVAARADSLLITQGATEALSLALRALTQPGDKVLIESPVYFGLHQTLASLQLQPIELPCSAESGLSPEAVEQALQDWPEIRCLVLTPNFQNPLGALMPDEAKRRLLRVAEAHELPIIEDDIFGDLHFGKTRPRPLKAWDRDDRVLLCASVSKTLGPSCQIGWCLSERHAKALAGLKLSASLGGGALMQRLLADWLRDGQYEAQLARLRKTLAAQSARYVQALRRHFGARVDVQQPPGGMLLWLRLARGVDSIALLKQALPLGLSFSPGTVFSAQGRHAHCLRLNIGRPFDEEVDQALSQLAALLPLAPGSRR